MTTKAERPKRTARNKEREERKKTREDQKKTRKKSKIELVAKKYQLGIEVKKKKASHFCYPVSSRRNKLGELISHIVTQKKGQQKPPRVRKGPLMSNRRKNRHTRKARNFQYTQKAFEQNRKATF